MCNHSRLFWVYTELLGLFGCLGDYAARANIVVISLQQAISTVVYPFTHYFS